MRKRKGVPWWGMLLGDAIRQELKHWDWATQPCYGAFFRDLCRRCPTVRLAWEAGMVETGIMGRLAAAPLHRSTSAPDVSLSVSAKKNSTKTILPRQSSPPPSATVEQEVTPGEHAPGAPQDGPAPMMEHGSIGEHQQGGPPCSRCKTQPRRPRGRYCKRCHAESMKESRRRIRARAQAATPPPLWEHQRPDPSQMQAICEWCHQSFTPHRLGQRFCGNVCGCQYARAEREAARNRPR